MMVYNLVAEKLSQSGYEPKIFEKLITRRATEGKEFVEKISLLPSFDHVYVDAEEKEAYILVEKDSIFSNEEIQQYVDEIVGFIALRPNETLKYNVNLIMVCPLNLKNKENYNYDPAYQIMSYEKDRYFFRKIFIDACNPNIEEEINILPFMPITVDFNAISAGYEGIAAEVKSVLGHEELFTNLGKRDVSPQLDAIIELLRLEGKDSI
jgi:hypothetical protein